MGSKPRREPLEIPVIEMTLEQQLLRMKKQRDALVQLLLAWSYQASGELNDDNDETPVEMLQGAIEELQEKLQQAEKAEERAPTREFLSFNNVVKDIIKITGATYYTEEYDVLDPCSHPPLRV